MPIDRDFNICNTNSLALSFFNLETISSSDGLIFNELLNLYFFGCGYNSILEVGFIIRVDIISFFLCVMLKFFTTAYPRRSRPAILVDNPLNGVIFISLILFKGVSILPRGFLFDGLIFDVVAHACIPRIS